MSRTNKLLFVLGITMLAVLACNAPTDDQVSRATDAAVAQATLDALNVTVVPTPTIAPTSVSGFARISIENAAGLRPIQSLAGSDTDMPIEVVAWSRDSSLMAAAADVNVGLIETATWEQEKVITTESSVAEIALSPNGFLMLTVPGLDGRTGAIWDTQTGQPTRTEIGLAGVTHGMWSPDGTLLAVSRAGGVVEVIEMSSGRRVASFDPRDAAPDIPPDLPSPITGLWVSPNGQLVAASVDQPAYLIVWHIEEEVVVDAFDFRQQIGDIAVRAQISPAWNQFVWVTENTVVLAELQSGANREALTFEDTVHGFGWSPDGTILAVATSATVDGASTAAVKLIDADSTQEIAVITRNWSDIPEFVVFSPDGSMLAIPNGDGTISIWAVQE